MKSFLVLAIALFGFSCANAAEVPDSLLTPAQRTYVEAKSSTAAVSSWVGVGKEVGEAVNSSMSAITTQTNNFAQTDVGRLTIALVIWKLLHTSIAAVLAIILTWILAFLFVLITWFMFVRKDGDKNDIWKAVYSCTAALTLVVTIISILNI